MTITITGNNGSMSFNPELATIQVGQTVVWRNADSILHHPVQDTPGDNSGGGGSGYGGGGGTTSGFDGGEIAAGASSPPITMRTSGTFNYHCTIHPGMTGQIKVGS